MAENDAQFWAVKEQEIRIAHMEDSLVQIRRLSMGWSYGQDGIHLLWINKVANEALEAGK